MRDFDEATVGHPGQLSTDLSCGVADLLLTAPRGLEGVLADELRDLGLADAREARGGARATGSLEDAYRVCLWSRVANRVSWVLDRFAAADPDALYAGVRRTDWSRHIAPDGTLAVQVTSSRSEVAHERYAAQRVKDAIVDQLREQFGRRPDVDRTSPDVRVHVQLRENEAAVAIDLSGESLHRRGYRVATGAAPLKETVAAGILRKAGWAGEGAVGRPLVDPMAGSGTFVIEAAMTAADRAPGLLRERFGLERWLGHDAHAWASLVAEAEARIRPAPEVPLLVGLDADPRAVAAAWRNARAAGVEPWVRFDAVALDALAGAELPAGPGLVVTNPPYGVRIATEPRGAERTFAILGRALRGRFAGWDAWVLAADEEQVGSLGLRPERRNVIFNGAIECRLLHVPIRADARDVPAVAPEAHKSFANRLAKNVGSLRRWAEREDVHALRLYDADIPEYAVAVDRYEDHVVVQEYAPPAEVDRRKAGERLDAILEAVPRVLAIPPANVHLKVRRKMHDRTQVERLAWTDRFHIVREGRLRFFCNFDDTLDTGLFLDHRPTRAWIRELSRGRRVLNLFGYTGTASVYAADGGAQRVVTVDLSNTYLEWARKNFELNRQRDDVHVPVRADVTRWVDECSESFDLVFVDPPTFSTSKSMETTWDVQRDHASLLERIVRLLAPGGTLIFSTNAQRFRFAADAPHGRAWQDVTERTIPKDFARSPHAHRCWALLGD